MTPRYRTHAQRRRAAKLFWKQIRRGSAGRSSAAAARAAVVPYDSNAALARMRAELDDAGMRLIKR